MAPVSVRPLILCAALACLAVSGPALSRPAARQNSASAELKVHEWGTFTSIADHTGQAVRWWPLNGSVDLPSFVEHFRTADFKVGLQGTVRMETPVLYFYSPTETTVSVKVGFSKGVITEWYPHASHIEPNPKSVLDGAALFQHPKDGSIAWNSVTVTPGLAANFPRNKDDRTHYYAARETAAAPLVVPSSTGEQQEKFLFYRGVSVFPVPVAAQALPDGKVLVRNLGPDEIPRVILFERRGDKLGYRVGGAVQHEASMDPPEMTSTLESMSHDLEAVLVAQGLYPDEAHAMVETWRGSWFEEGSRLLYIVPANFVNAVLPLRINPTPSQTVRAFVGRLELITPATERAVEAGLAAHDQQVIQTYGRFLEPILEQMKKENPDRASQLDQELMDTYSQRPPKEPAK